jgi:hypothetical protein
MMFPGITVVIPTIRPRDKLMDRALASVNGQTLRSIPIHVEIERDVNRKGAAVTRNTAAMRVETEWTAFLDDDDYFYPEHLEKLKACADETSADYVYSWYDVVGGTDPRPEVFGQPFDSANPVQTTITTLVRTELVKSTGFLAEEEEDLASPDRHYAGEDWRFTLRCVNAGAKIVHLPEKTWAWVHWAGNTSGLPKNWS